jgi:L-aminopeptidase/D-esterase-like protein
MAATFGAGWRVGHHTDPEGPTGCTVVIPPRGNVASCDIRGSSPGSRELASLDVQRKLTEVHAVLLTGGSAFGLAAADGVMSWLEAEGTGYQTPIGVIPIVPAAVVFDLGSANRAARPGPAAGRAACDAASEGTVATGRVGAGTGCTVGKWAGREFAAPGGLGFARETEGPWSASALAVVNSVGDVLAADGTVLAGTTAENPTYRPPPATDVGPSNTVLAVVGFEATLDKRAVHWLSTRGSDGITTSVRPAHTRYDGDVVFAVAAPGPPGEPADLDVLGHLATRAVAAAVRDAVRPR